MPLPTYGIPRNVYLHISDRMSWLLWPDHQSIYMDQYVPTCDHKVEETLLCTQHYTCMSQSKDNAYVSNNK